MFLIKHLTGQLKHVPVLVNVCPGEDMQSERNCLLSQSREMTNGAFAGLDCTLAHGTTLLQYMKLFELQLVIN